MKQYLCNITFFYKLLPHCNPRMITGWVSLNEFNYDTNGQGVEKKRKKTPP